MNSDFGLPL